MYILNRFCNPHSVIFKVSIILSSIPLHPQPLGPPSSYYPGAGGPGGPAPPMGQNAPPPMGMPNMPPPGNSGLVQPPTTNRGATFFSTATGAPTPSGQAFGGPPSSMAGGGGGMPPPPSYGGMGGPPIPQAPGSSGPPGTGAPFYPGQNPPAPQMYGMGGITPNPNSATNLPSAFGSGNNLSERQQYGTSGFPGPYGVPGGSNPLATVVQPPMGSERGQNLNPEDASSSSNPLPLINEMDLSIQCNPVFMQASIGKIVVSQAASVASKIPIGLVCKPMAGDVGIGNDLVDVVDFGQTGIVRCKRCRTYINPFVTWTDNGRRWRCNICGMLNDIPSSYFSHLDNNGQRRDRDQR